MLVTIVSPVSSVNLSKSC